MYGTLVLTPKISSGYRYSSRYPWVKSLATGQFAKRVIDYQFASKSGRGQVWYYFLAPGMYDVYEPVSWKRDKRYRIRVADDGEIIRA